MARQAPSAKPVCFGRRAFCLRQVFFFRTARQACTQSSRPLRSCRRFAPVPRPGWRISRHRIRGTKCFHPRPRQDGERGRPSCLPQFLRHCIPKPLHSGRRGPRERRRRTRNPKGHSNPGTAANPHSGSFGSTSEASSKFRKADHSLRSWLWRSGISVHLLCSHACRCA